MQGRSVERWVRDIVHKTREEGGREKGAISLVSRCGVRNKKFSRRGRYSTSVLCNSKRTRRRVRHRVRVWRTVRLTILTV